MATVDVLTTGYVGERVAGTVVLVRDGDVVAVVDPGMVASRALILDPLRQLGLSPGEVTDVVFSHHHPDHTVNAALFGRARVHDFQAIYVDDQWIDRELADEPDGWALAEHTRLLYTPGHSAQDLSTVVSTPDGLVVCTHAWWHAGGPELDPYAPDAAVLAEARARLLALEPALIVPGHGPAFAPARG
jgi:glyoxylase-like metal-dependent hydrolase (beta-lactamase superfamily II)